MENVGSPSTTDLTQMASSHVASSDVPTSAGRRIMGRSKRSQEQIARIEQHIAEQQLVSSAQLSALIGLDAGTMSRYLRHMCNTGVIHKARGHCSDPGRTHPALYCSGDMHANVDAWAEQPSLVRKVADWPRGSAFRDPLVAALFGPACHQLSV